MKKFIAITLVACFSFIALSSNAEEHSHEFKNRRIVTFNDNIYCPKSNESRCGVTISIDDAGSIGIEFYDPSASPRYIVENPTGSDDPQEIITVLEQILESEEGLPIVSYE